MRGKSIAFLNVKGGVAKTTSIWNVAGEMSNKGFRVLLLDFDRQRNLTNIALSDEQSEYISGLSDTIYDVFLGESTFGQVVKKCYVTKFNKEQAEYIGIDVIPGSPMLGNSNIKDNYIGVKEAFEDFAKGYDYILIDMPACHEGINEICFRDFADYIIVPFTSDIQSLEGYEILMDIVNKAREENESLELLGIFLSRYMKSKKLDIFVYEQLKRFSTFIDIQIPLHDDVRFSTAYNQPLVYFKKNEYSYRWVANKEKVKGEYIETGESKVDKNGVSKEKIGAATPLKSYRILTEYIINKVSKEK